MTNSKTLSGLTDEELRSMKESLVRQIAAVNAEMALVNAEISARWDECEQRLRAERAEFERKIRDIQRPTMPAPHDVYRGEFLPSIWPHAPGQYRVGDFPNLWQATSARVETLADDLLRAAGYEDKGKD